MTAIIHFAHRGAPIAPVRGNTLAAFTAALEDGAEGVESDVRLTSDGVPVLVHGLGRIGGRPIREVRRADLPRTIPSLADLWERCGNGFELALDMVDPDAAPAVVDLARRHDAVPRLWLTYWRLPTVAAWSKRWPEIKIVYPTMFAFPEPVLRRTVMRIAAAGGNVINLHHRLISRRSAAVAHTAGLRLFAWGLRRRADVRRAVSLDVDGVFIDDIAAAR